MHRLVFLGFALILVSGCTSDVATDIEKELFVRAPYFPTHLAEYDKTKENYEKRIYVDGSKKLTYYYRGPKASEKLPLSIDGIVALSSSALGAKLSYHAAVLAERMKLKMKSGVSIEEKTIETILGEPMVVFSIKYNDSEVGTYAAAVRGKVFYSFQIVGVYLEGEQVWGGGFFQE